MNIKQTSNKSLPIQVHVALKKLGRDLSDARKRRRITMALMAERAGINRRTLSKIEKGEPTVLMASYAQVLFVLGMTDRLKDFMDANYDLIGRDLEEENLPKRIRKSGLNKAKE
ncbi:MAG: helix-turn-helix domain-containing protein [Gammaproteobacteria bacterium]